MTPVSYFQIPAEALVPSRREIGARLGAHGREVPEELIEKAREDLLPHIRACCSFVRVPVTRTGERAVDLGFGPIGSRDLASCLDGCSRAVVSAVTLCSEVDRYLLRLAAVSPAGQFTADALASAYAEAACDYAEKIIFGDAPRSFRFSPGYGDFPLSFQPDVLRLTDAGRRLGITLGRSFLMSPSKSVTSVTGIKDENADET